MYTALALYDVLRKLPMPIHTFIEGKCFSAATLLALAGEKRYMSDHSVLLLHSISLTVDGNLQDHRIELENTEQLMKYLYQIYQERMGLDEEQTKNLLSERELSRQKAVDIGFINT